MAYVPQIQQVNPLVPITVEQVLKMAADRISGKPAKGNRVDISLTVFDPGLRHTSFHHLSSGRATAPCRTGLGFDSVFLILDEHWRMQIQSGERVQEELLRIQSECMLLVVTHDISFVYAMFRQVLCVNRAVWTHHTHELDATLLRELYGGQLRWVDHDNGNCNVSHDNKMIVSG